MAFECNSQSTGQAASFDLELVGDRGQEPVYAMQASLRHGYGQFSEVAIIGDHRLVIDVRESSGIGFGTRVWGGQRESTICWV